ncbi:MAG: TolC family protein [Flavobacteriales bacterium]|nr:TolC family protein [Flavobacteriia bacterium]NCP05843.1 TolC family protein [Flavobacteriales bacterium]NCP60915.1 TolC family protein [Flavobacteriales bacterium]NCQ14665.1 TolC family protein [Flavobacteriales bacterium]
MNKLILKGLLVLVSFSVSGQQHIWTIQECLETGLKNSFDVKIKQLAMTQAKKSHYPFLLSLSPSISVTGSHSYDFGSTIDPSTNARVSSDFQYDNIYLNARVNLLNFENIAQSAKGKVDIELAKADKEVVEYTYKMQLLENYFEVVYTQELLKIQEEQMVNTQFNVDRIGKEVSIGKKPKSDWYDIQLSHAQEQKQLLETRQLYHLQKLQLFQLMNIEENTENLIFAVSIEGEIDLHGTYKDLAVENPRLLLAELNYQNSLKNVAVQRASKMPLLTGYYTLSSFYTNELNSNIIKENFEDQINANKSSSAGLQLNIPIFNGFRNSKNIAVSKIESEKSKEALEQAKNSINQQLREESTKKMQYQQLQEILQTTLHYAEESFKTTQHKFESDKIDAVTFTSVKNQLLASKYDVLKNNLLVQYTALKIKLLKINRLE